MMSGYLLLKIFFVYFIVFSYTSNGLTTKKQEVESLQMQWQNITMVWCSSKDYPEPLIDDAYECFRASRGDKEFSVQIECENEIFPSDKMSKNDVRRAMCSDDSVMIKNFDECYAKKGIGSNSPKDDEKKMTESQIKEKSENEMTKFRTLIVIIQLFLINYSSVKV